MIKVKRNSDGKVFTNDMSERESIYEIHFCTSYTQVLIQEDGDDGILTSKDIICESMGTSPNPLDLIATQDDETGMFI